MAERSNRPEVRNPLLSLPAIQRLHALPPEAKTALLALLTDLRRDACLRAERCWKCHKAPMAAYWKAVAVYAGHLARSLRKEKEGESYAPEKE